MRIKIAKLFDNEGHEVKIVKSKFEKIVQEVSKATHIAMKHINGNNFNSAVNIFCKWADILENTNLANQMEEDEMKQYLIKIYLNLCLCYNKLSNPQKTCLAMRELEKLTSIANNPKYKN